MTGTPSSPMLFVALAILQDDGVVLGDLGVLLLLLKQHSFRHKQTSLIPRGRDEVGVRHQPVALRDAFTPHRSVVRARSSSFTLR